MPEIWDVYDVNRQRTGRTIEREKTWGNEKYHLIVHVGIFNLKGQMLIQKRCHEKHAWADLWDISAGGSALAGEDSREAAERETFEELGVRISLKGIRPHFSINYERGFDDFYAVTEDLDLRKLALQASEVSDARWAGPDEVRQMEKEGLFVPYFSGVIDLLWQVRDNYDGAICQHRVP